jgi:hypothetical protein
MLPNLLTNIFKQANEPIWWQSPEWIGVWLSIIAIGFSIAVFVMQNKQTDRMNRIIESTKLTNDTRKIYYLTRIDAYTNHIRKHLLTFQERVARYENDPSIENWEIVKNHANFAMAQTKAFGDSVKEDFVLVVDIIGDHYLVDKYQVICVDFSIQVFNLAVADEIGYQRLQEIKERMEEQLVKMDDMLSRISNEKPASHKD